MDTLLLDQQKLLKLAELPFYQKTDFYIFLILGIAGILISLWAVQSAKNAATAANEAKRVVHIQSIIIELTDLNSKLSSLKQNIDFYTARDYILEIDRRISRQTSILTSYSQLTKILPEIDNYLRNINISLNSVRPIEKNNVNNTSVYHAIESDLRLLSSEVAKLIGVLQNETIIVNLN